MKRKRKPKLKPRAPLPLARRIPVLLDGEVSVSCMIECLAAAHLSNYVDSPFHERGGIMLVGPPGSLRTTLTRALEFTLGPREGMAFQRGGASFSTGFG